MGPKSLAASPEHSGRGSPAPGAAATVDARRAPDAASGRGHAKTTEPSIPVFELVYEQHFNFVWRSLRLLGVEPEALEDAAQEVFSVVSRQLARFEGRSSLQTWLFAIMQRVAANHRRTRRRKLQQLGQRFQVVCITHLPQIASRASTHFQIEKSTRGHRTVTAVQQLDSAGRIEEISRMIGGRTVTEPVRASAREMLGIEAKGKQKAKGESESR